MALTRDCWLSWRRWSRWFISTLSIWLIGDCAWSVRAAGCSKLKLSETLYQSSREGTYHRTSSVCNGKSVYRHSRGTNYIYYIKTSGWNGWMIGTTECTNNGGLAVETSSQYPEEAGESWEEVYEESWYFNTHLELNCYTVSTGTIVGIVLGVLMALSLGILIYTRFRQRSQRQRMLSQQPRRPQVATVTRYPAGPGGPRHPGPGGVRPRGPPPPRMQHGYGHGPMVMKPGQGHRPMMPRYPARPVGPPGYPGVGAPMAPGYPMSVNMGPPPPYQPPYNHYPGTDPCYPPPQHPGQQPQQPGQPPQQPGQPPQPNQMPTRNFTQHGHMAQMSESDIKVD